MVDIHSHILPGIDDGARTLEESLHMLDIAARSGTTDIVATPHANVEFPYDPAKIRHAFESLRSHATGINLHLASDFHLSYENLLAALSRPDQFTINGHQYLMVELPDFLSLHVVKEALIQLVNARFVPVITHPERNLALQTNQPEIESWVQSGALVQITAQSLTGRFGSAAKRAADKLLKSNLVHFIASDAHDCIHRPPDLSSAYQYVARLRTRAVADALFIHNPAATLYGDPLPAKRKPRRSFRLFR